MVLMGAIGLGAYYAPLAPNRSFPVFHPDGSIVYPEYAYPIRKEVVPIWLSAFISFFAPFVFFVLFQIRRRSLDDLLTTTMGLLKSLITAAVFQVWVKWLIGGFRPHFYAVCIPNVAQFSRPSGTQFANYMYDRSVCTGDTKAINDALESFPSGHSTAAFACLIFLTLYFNAQLKWKMILFFIPVLGAVLIAGALTIDKFHHHWDVIGGALIGAACAFVAFRQTFASVWDFRFNHLLLPRTTSLLHRTPYYSGTSLTPSFSYQPQVDTLSHNLPAAREGGWGWRQEAIAGASFDTTVLFGGVENPGSGGVGGGTLRQTDIRGAGGAA
ncbi:acid phosphatase/Vanadium-dependent haloperoxidase [Thelephora ganbajun]|uniref:Acid phosphatase/Vanadium-dependent haloperoxidase n=1 Tax=Thelephora ganbajun TaxID=370292 RepID=A0ACB6ZD06_THEGA|nr:acid phosphatase/Vanadium-dependent haloperoxidase [Thelephora ganbajun]